ncbi:hypothetical protein OG978_41955 (plasmid) [Streptomyces sp. NBC_01591]|uniref:hypothetical protein n=1 Tax=Streptomyces sp. NBC_01591 TaxID=2975888 RepID=UPI002DDB5BAF|nr:hypothetical protein [Streptomyces sp. NBC_01591]WSD73773.1 hypothetical protein OG978_41955 [Streptomyces sp. NBC_01591]
MTTTTSKLQTDAGWDGPYYRVLAEGFEALFLPSPDEVLDEVCNVDVEVHLPDGSRWSATIFTLAEVDRLMRKWEGVGEAAGGRCFWCSDGLIVRDPGIQGIVGVIAKLLASGEFDGAFHRLSDPE